MPHAEILWIGSQGGMEQSLVQRHGISYRGIRTGQLRGVNPLKALFNILKMLDGVRQSQTILREFRPQVCLVTGGYVCVPVVIACRLAGIPVLIYLPDMTPGWAIKLMSKVAQRVAVSHVDAARHFGGEWPQGKAVVTGYPVRPELIAAAQDRAAARRRLAEQLNRNGADRPGWTTTTMHQDDAPLLLVWGASQGARSINRATWAALEQLTPHAHVLHIVGTRDWSMAQDPAENPAAADGAADTLVARYCAVDYLHEAMVDALAAADLTVGRAGASILGEFTIPGLPSVLVPLPIAGGHQEPNAAVLAQAGAAVIIEDAALGAELVDTVVPLLQDTARRATMRHAAREMAQPHAAASIAQLLAQMAVPASGPRDS